MRPKRVASLALALVVLPALAACGTAERGGHTQPSPLAMFSASVKRVVIEVDYAANAAPFTGAVGSFPDLWAITQDNVSALYGGSERELVIPSTLAEMHAIDATPGPYRTADIEALAAKYRTVYSSGDTVSLFVVFLDGRYELDADVDETVLGAALAGSGIIAMFKPTIDGVNNPLSPDVVRFTEQATLIHELGHSFGLVNVGLPLVSNHEDPRHPSHCDDPDCVMYWANEGAADVRRFTSDVASTGSDVLFDGACLADAHAAARGLDTDAAALATP
ncbi:MAG TPA: hypothetical protein VH142_05430 [Polyangiaceae bacterium]|jgi:predicted Zn-dependent protease|nr:hypothetical protein [Polyangiaceae bacterium]